MTETNKNILNLVRQVQDAIKANLCISEPIYPGYRFDIDEFGIYSWSAYKNCITKGCAFVKWASEHHGCRTLDEARTHADAFIKTYVGYEYSADARKHTAIALSNLYRDSSIYPYGGGRAGLSVYYYREFIDFCKATRLYRREIKRLTPGNLRYDKATGNYMLTGIRKAAYQRDFPVLSEEAVARIQNTRSGKKVWEEFPSNADFHAYRAEYCKTIYELHARPIAEVPESERYYCSGDLIGIAYDKPALLIASQALGHNQVFLISGHYLFITNGGECL